MSCNILAGFCVVCRVSLKYLKLNTFLQYNTSLFYTPFVWYKRIIAFSCLCHEGWAAQTQPKSGENGLDISLLPLDCPSDKKDTRSTSTSATTTQEDREDEMWDERKWVVNESNLMELFKRCEECWAVITKTKDILREPHPVGVRKRTSGAVEVLCRCSGNANLLVSANVLVTGSTYTDVTRDECLMTKPFLQIKEHLFNYVSEHLFSK